MNKHTIAVIGCGWLGEPLAKYLINAGYKVFGTTTSSDKIQRLSESGIKPSIFDINNFSEKDVPSADVYFINIPPSTVEGYASKIGELIQLLPASAQQILFCSSTSVYADKPGEATEDMVSPGQQLSFNEPDNANHGTRRSELILAEGAVWESGKSVILRLSGLFGAGRHPVKYLAGRENLSSPDAVVNLVHLDDVIAVSLALIEQKTTNRVFNVTSDEHPTRKEYYSDAAGALGLSAPKFDEKDRSTGKIISNQSIKNFLKTKIPLRNPN